MLPGDDQDEVAAWRQGQKRRPWPDDRAVLLAGHDRRHAPGPAALASTINRTDYSAARRGADPSLGRIRRSPPWVSCRLGKGGRSGSRSRHASSQHAETSLTLVLICRMPGSSAPKADHGSTATRARISALMVSGNNHHWPPAPFLATRWTWTTPPATAACASAWLRGVFHPDFPLPSPRRRSRLASCR